MAKKNPMYDIIFDVYELQYSSKQLKDTARRLLKRKLEKFFPDKEWEELLQIEKDMFVYVGIKEDMFKHYQNDSNKQETISKKIDEKLKSMTGPLLEHNKKIYNEYRDDYYKPNASDTPKKKAYMEFCKDLSEINNRVPIPSYDEWVQWNENILKNPRKSGASLRIYDYLETYYHNLESENAQVKYKVSQAEIDHVVLEILKKIIEEKFETKIEINIPKIIECLSYVKNNEFDEFAKQSIRDDFNLNTEENINEEERLKYIEDNARYIMYMEMLRKLDFYVENKTDIEEQE